MMPNNSLVMMPDTSHRFLLFRGSEAHHEAKKRYQEPLPTFF